MENPIDHPLDLGLVNYLKHPSNSNYVVFRFSDEARALSFEESLRFDNIWFEKGEEENRTKRITLFGIHKTDYKKVEKINYMVEAKHKKKLISFAWLRYTILIFSAIVMTLALVGYCKAQSKLAQETNEINNI